MDRKHRIELTELSQEIYDQVSDKLNNYISGKYCAIGNDTMEQQMEDYLFVAEEVSAYFLGNAMALLDPATQETEIRTFTDTLRRVADYAQKKMDMEQNMKGRDTQ